MLKSLSDVEFQEDTGRAAKIIDPISWAYAKLSASIAPYYTVG